MRKETTSSGFGRFLKKHKKYFVLPLVILVLLLALAAAVMIDRFTNRSDIELNEEEAVELIEEALKSVPKKVSAPMIYIDEKSSFKVQSVEYGTERDVLVHCDYQTIDVLSVYTGHKEELFTSAYSFFIDRDSKGQKTSATHIMVQFSNQLQALFEDAPPISGQITFRLYDVAGEKLTLWLDDETVDAYFGGALSVRKDIAATTELTYNGEKVSIANNNSLRTGISDCFGFNNFSSERPDTSSPLQRKWNEFKNDFYKNFIKDNHWKYLTRGLANTLSLTGLSLMLGILIGFIVSVIRCTHDKAGGLTVLNKIVEIYVTVVRGTPVMIQLMIIYFVVLLPVGVNSFTSAVICFGLNSGAYVSEIIRGGIMAVDDGQTEAGRSLGFGFASTMVYVVLPQAFKAVLPALCNEFIALLKETSIAFYIGVADLTQGGLTIRSLTYSNFMPLIAIALIYLLIVLFLSKLFRMLERRLRKSER